jgi:hypothetical protein
MKTNCWAVHSIYGLEVFETRAEMKQYHLDSGIFTRVPVGEYK